MISFSLQYITSGVDLMSNHSELLKIHWITETGGGYRWSRERNVERKARETRAEDKEELKRLEENIKRKE